MGDSASDVTDNLLANYYALAAFVVLYYDYVLTFSMEVQRFWPQRGFSWAVFFFYLNRYLSLLGHIPLVIEYFFHRLSNALNPCLQIQSYHQYFAIVIQLVVGVLLIMRVYALYNRSRVVLAFLCITAGGIVAFGCWAILSGQNSSQTIPAVMSDTGCPDHPLTNPEGIRFAAAWAGLLVFDIIVFGMTVAKAIRVGRMGDRALILVLLQDGAVYFLVIGLANLSNILTLLLGGPIIRGMGSTFTNVISTVMISRLMLNLRSPSLTREKALTSTGSAAYLTNNQHCVSEVAEGPSNVNRHVDFLQPSATLADGAGPSNIELLPRGVSQC